MYVRTFRRAPWLPRCRDRSHAQDGRARYGHEGSPAQAPRSHNAWWLLDEVGQPVREAQLSGDDGLLPVVTWALHLLQSMCRTFQVIPTPQSAPYRLRVTPGLRHHDMC